MRSTYVEWVKKQTGVKFNLANSGVRSYPLCDLGVDLRGLDLSGPGAYGYPPLKAAIAAKKGVSEECVTTVLGTSRANWLTMAATLEPADEVVMEHPAYPLLLETAEYLVAAVKFFDRRAESGFSINVDAVPSAVTAKTCLIVVTNLHNPSCALMPQSGLRAIGVMAQKIGARVLMDEVYLDLRGDATPPKRLSLGRTFYLH